MNCERNFTFLAQVLASSKNLVRCLQGARILHRKCPFSCSVSRILQDIFPWEWSSPCVLVPKSDGTYHFCTDFRKVNSVTKTNFYPILRIDGCIDRIGHSKYVSKFDLFKGYWQVPLTEKAKEVSAFVTPDGLFQYRVMPFGMKNAPATFQRMINSIYCGLKGCDAYLDDIVVYSATWEDHVQLLRDFFVRVQDAQLTNDHQFT